MPAMILTVAGNCGVDEEPKEAARMVSRMLAEPEEEQEVPGFRRLGGRLGYLFIRVDALRTCVVAQHTEDAVQLELAAQRQQAQMMHQARAAAAGIVPGRLGGPGRLT